MMKQSKHQCNSKVRMENHVNLIESSRDAYALPSLSSECMIVACGGRACTPPGCKNSVRAFFVEQHNL